MKPGIRQSRGAHGSQALQLHPDTEAHVTFNGHLTRASLSPSKTGASLAPHRKPRAQPTLSDSESSLSLENQRAFSFEKPALYRNPTNPSNPTTRFEILGWGLLCGLHNLKSLAKNGCIEKKDKEMKSRFVLSRSPTVHGIFP
jgi:hypothetical protein